jgi:hypothetical protein
LKCLECDGTGQKTCWRCDGQGSTVGKYTFGGGSPAEDPCSACEGERRTACEDCHGSGTVQHEPCGGEGKVGTWEEEVYTYSTDITKGRTRFPTGAPVKELTAALDRWMAFASQPLPNLERASVVKALGYDFPDLDGVIGAAHRLRDSLAAKMAADYHYRSLSVTATFHVVPLAAYLFRTQARRGSEQFWVLGRGEEAVDIAPAGRRWMGIRWAARSQGIIFCFYVIWLVSLRSTEAAFDLAFASLTTLLSYDLLIDEFPGLLGAVVRLNLRRFGGRVRTIAVLGTPDETSLLASCLTTVGSHARRLEVVGARARSQLERIMGRAPTARETAPILVRLADGRVVRLLFADPPASEPERDALGHVVDGVVTLDAALVEKLETIRTSYLREHEDGARDWPAIFDELWAPIETAKPLSMLPDRDSLPSADKSTEAAPDHVSPVTGTS